MLQPALAFIWTEYCDFKVIDQCRLLSYLMHYFSKTVIIASFMKMLITCGLQNDGNYMSPFSVLELSRFSL